MSKTRHRSLSPNVVSNSVRKAGKSSKSGDDISIKGVSHASIGPVGRDLPKGTLWRSDEADMIMETAESCMCSIELTGKANLGFIVGFLG